MPSFAILTTVTTRAYLLVMPTTGAALRAKRRAAEITTVDLAERMGVSRPTLWRIERDAVVTTERADQYRAALADAIEASRAKVA